MAHILVIEDNEDNLQLMTYLLTAFGHNIVAARDGEIGLAKLEEAAFDLVVCDIHLPKLDGYEIIKRIRQRPNPTTPPIIAVTALAMVGDRERLLAAGFDAYISKPIEPQQLVDLIQTQLAEDQRAASERPQQSPSC
jgi:two-component system cell cycle response regulator